MSKSNDKSKKDFKREFFTTFTKSLLPYIVAAFVAIVTFALKMVVRAAVSVYHIFVAKHEVKDIDDKYIKLLDRA